MSEGLRDCKQFGNPCSRGAGLTQMFDQDGRGYSLYSLNVYYSGDPDQYRKARYNLLRAIKAAKRAYRTKVESSYHGSDPRRMWSGLRAITDYKGRCCSETSSSVLLPDELNAFYTRFERDIDPPAVELPEGLASGVPTLTVAQVRHC